MSIDAHELSPEQIEVLRRLAPRYIWWKSLDEALRHPQRIIAQVMNMGDWDDIVFLIGQFDDDTLRDVIGAAEIGQFNPRAWHYWHYRLGLATYGEVPPLPDRRFP